MSAPLPVSTLSRRHAIALLGLVIFAWGSTWPVNKLSLQDVTPIWSCAFRTAVGMLALLVLQRGRVRLPLRGDVPVVLSVALLHMSAFSMLSNIGLQHVPAGRSVVLAYTTPLWVGPGARWLLGEAFTWQRAAGCALGLAGLLFIFNPLTFDWNDAQAVQGNAMILLAAMFWAASILYVRAHKWLADPFSLLFWQTLLATCVLSVCAWYIEGWPHINWHWALVLQLLYSGLFGVALAYWAITLVNRALPAMTTSLGLLGVPIFGIACSTLFLGEQLRWPLLAAMVLIIGGIALGTFSRPAVRRPV